MEMTQPFQGITLQLLDAQEYKLEGRSTLEFTNDHQPLFGFVHKGAIKITSHAELHRRTATVTYGDVFLLPSDCHSSIQNSDKWPSQLILLRFQCLEGPDSGPLSISHLFSAGQAPPRLVHFRMPRFRNWVQDLVCESWRSDASAYFIAQSFTFLGEFIQTNKKRASRTAARPLLYFNLVCTKIFYSPSTVIRLELCRIILAYGSRAGKTVDLLVGMFQQVIKQ